METYTSFRGFTLSNLVFTVGVDTKTATQNVNNFFAAFDKAAQDTDSKLKSTFEQPVTKKVQLVFEGGKVLAKELNVADEQAKKIKLTAQAVNQEWAKTPKQLKTQVASLRTLLQSTNKYSADGKTVTKEWKLLADALRAGVKEMKKLEVEASKMDKKQPGKNMAAEFLKANLAAKAVAKSLDLLVQAINNVVQSAFEMEVLEIQLQAFTGGATEASAALAYFSEIAAGTPFDLGQIAGAGKIMMAFGVETKVAANATKNLAVVATATGGDLNNLARNLGQIAAQGQAYTRDLTQFAIQGIPIWSEMSAITGKTVSELKKLATEGKISFDIVNGALKNLAAEGGKYAEIVKEMENTMQGQMSRLRTNVQKLSLSFINAAKDIAKAFGTDLYAPFKALNNELQYIGENFPTIIAGILEAFRNLSPVLGAIGGLMLAIFGPAIIAAIGGFIVAIKAAVVALKAKIAAQIALLATMGPKGWAMLTGAVVASTAAMYAFGQSMKPAEDALKKQQAEMDKAKKEAEKLKAGVDDASTSFENAFDDSTAKRAEERVVALNVEAVKLKSEYKEMKRFVDLTKKAIQQKAETAVSALQAEKRALDKAKGEELRQIKDAQKEADKAHKEQLRNIEDQEKAVQTASENKIRAIEEESRVIEDQVDLLEEQYSAAKKSASEISDRRIAALDREREAVERTMKEELAGIEKTKEARTAAHENKMKNLEAAKEALKASYDAEKAAISELITLEEQHQRAAQKSLEASRKEAGDQYEVQIDAIEDAIRAEELLTEETIRNLEARAQAIQADADNRVRAIQDIISAEERLNDNTNNEINTRYAGEIQALENLKASMQVARDADIQGIKDSIQVVKERYDAEISRINELESAALGIYDDEITALQQLTPAEERLQEIRIASLQAKAANLELTEKERLEAQAQLDNMERQAAIAEVRLARSQAQAEFEQRRQELLKEQEASLAAQDQLLEERSAHYEAELASIEASIETAIAGKQAELEAEQARYDSRIQNLEREAEQIEANTESQIEAIEREIEARQEASEATIDNIESQREALKELYEAELEGIQAAADASAEQSEAKIEQLRAEQDALVGKFEAGVAAIGVLMEKEKQQFDAEMDLLDRSSSAIEDHYERVFDRIDRQIELEKERAERKQEQLDEQERKEKERFEKMLQLLEEEQKREEEKTKAELENLKKEEQGVKDKYDAEKEKMQEMKESTERFYEAKKQLIEDEIRAIKARAKAEIDQLDAVWDRYAYLHGLKLDALKAEADANKEVAKQGEEATSVTRTQATETLRLAQNAYRAAGGLNALADAQARVGSTGGGSGPATGSVVGARAEGGPVAGGSAYQVNELGREAFLSASGRLSMINAPSFGKWRAPSTGTVIPAHLTKQLDIPSSGISLNALNTAPSGMVSNVSNSSRVSSGDNISNTVTIQTSKPRQAASDVMVQLAKLKRVRYS